MMAPTHVAFGLACALTLDGYTGAVALAATAAAALLPDIDHPGATAGRALPMLSLPLSWLFGHRGMTHSVLAVVACFAAAGWLGGPLVARSAAIGYASHLAGDMICGRVPLLWPLGGRVGIRCFQVGSVVELLLTGLFVAAIGWALLA